MDSELYPDNSVLILENVFFHCEETGFIIDEEKNLKKIEYNERLQFIEKLNDYGLVYIIDDKDNIFNNYTSFSMLKYPNCVLSENIHKDIIKVSHCITLEKKNFLVIIGGDLK